MSINEAIPRLEKAFEIAELGKIELLDRQHATYYKDAVTKYQVNFLTEVCTCPDHQYRATKCKHIWACQLKIQAKRSRIAGVPVQ